MITHNDLGRFGEQKAVEYLTAKGYAILERNWVCGHKEVDIIAKDEETIVIIEVKTRKSTFLVAPEVTVDGFKQRNLIWAANCYVRMKNLDDDVRFDIVSIVVDNTGKFIIDHLEDAFYPKIK